MRTIFSFQLPRAYGPSYQFKLLLPKMAKVLPILKSTHKPPTLKILRKILGINDWQFLYEQKEGSENIAK